MSRTIEDIIWSEIMPPAIRNDSQVQALDTAITPQLQAVSQAIEECIILARLDELSETVVDLLAWQYHVDFYDKGLPIEQKRTLVKTSIDVHRHKGTPYAVQTVVSAILNGAQVLEWFNYGGEPYHFKVALITGPMASGETIEKLVKAINLTKNTRSWLDGVEFSRGINQTICFRGAQWQHKATAIGLPAFNIPNLTGKQYFSSTHYIHKEVKIANG